MIIYIIITCACSTSWDHVTYFIFVTNCILTDLVGVFLVAYPPVDTDYYSDVSPESHWNPFVLVSVLFNINRLSNTSFKQTAHKNAVCQVRLLSLWLMLQAVVSLDLCRYSCAVCSEISHHLGIHCFRITSKAHEDTGRPSVGPSNVRRQISACSGKSDCSWNGVWLVRGTVWWTTHFLVLRIFMCVCLAVWNRFFACFLWQGKGEFNSICVWWMPGYSFGDDFTTVQCF